MKTDSDDDREFSPKVNVLLSVYNPKPNWLTDQIASVKFQEDIAIDLLIRNDGFTKIHTALVGNLSTIEAGEHLGVGASYMELLSKCHTGGFGFCDQDDLWSKNKLSRKVQALKGLNSPAMAYCDFSIIDSEARKTGSHKSPSEVSKFSFLFRNNIPGFSMFFNDDARKILQESKDFFPQNAYHDWWSALAISLLGSCVHVPEELASYRIHNSNAVGLASNQWKRFDRLAKKLQSGLSENRQILIQMTKYIEYRNPDHLSIFFLKDIIQGMKLNRVKRLQILIRNGLLKSPKSTLITSLILYVVPSKLRSGD
jgi:hypothetical protein